MRLLQVESREQSRTQRPWLMKRDVADRLVVDDGVAADLMFHKSEQPSPISVLELPFEEESPSPLEFKEITNDLQGGQVLAITSTSYVSYLVVLCRRLKMRWKDWCF